MELLKSITVSVVLWGSLQAERACKNVSIKVTQVYTEEPHNKSFIVTLAWEITLRAQTTAQSSIADTLHLEATHRPTMEHLPLSFCTPTMRSVRQTMLPYSSVPRCAFRC
jgi:hypothetical protein